MIKLTSTLLLCTLMLGCATTPHANIGLPERPTLLPISQMEWERMSEKMQDTIQFNDIALKKYARRLESRIELHDAK